MEVITPPPQNEQKKKKISNKFSEHTHIDAHA
jgi:hypothetical protein